MWDVYNCCWGFSTVAEFSNISLLFLFVLQRRKKSCLENTTMYRSFWSILYIHFLLDRTILRVCYYLLVNSRIYVFIMYPPICAHKSDCTHTLHSNRIVLNTLIHMYWIQILQYVHHRLDVQISCICISISLSAGLHHPILMQHMHKDWNYYIGLYK